MQFHKTRFRIEGSGVSSDGVGQEQATVLFAEATWHASPTLDLSGFLGIAAGGNLRIETNSGNRIGDSDYDPAALLGLRLNIRL